MPESLFSAISNTRRSHYAVRDRRMEIKSCSCGVLFGVQHEENGTYEHHFDSQMVEAVLEWIKTEPSAEAPQCTATVTPNGMVTLRCVLDNEHSAYWHTGWVDGRQFNWR